MKQAITVAGFHSTQAVLEQSPEHVLKVWYRDTLQAERFAAIAQLCTEHGIAREAVKASKLDRHYALNQGVLAWCRPPAWCSFAWLEERSQQPSIRLLLLDRIHDPHNLGACLRTAEACGVDCVVLSRQCAPLSSTVAKVASGAMHRLPLLQHALPRTITMLRDHHVQVFGTSLESTIPYWDMPHHTAGAIVLGNEHSGIRHEVIKQCTATMHIPMLGKVESLNVSVSAGVLLYEMVRKSRGL